MADQAAGPSLQHVGANLPPPATVAAGKYCRLEPLDPVSHGAQLFAALQLGGGHRERWACTGPADFGTDDAAPTLEMVTEWATALASEPGQQAFAIVVPQGSQPATSTCECEWAAAGTLALKGWSSSENVRSGTCEVGRVVHAQPLAGTRAATEAHFLILQRAFASGCRRVGWSCNAGNHRSIVAAQRLGYVPEGVHYNAVVQEKHGGWLSRDTAYLSVLDREWVPLAAEFEAWLDRSNFDGETGRQLSSLSARTLRLPSLRRGGRLTGWPWEDGGAATDTEEGQRAPTGLSRPEAADHMHGPSKV
eukprot:SAG22_NODE_2133_length_2960_cov_2.910870_6_plen_306_part_00